MTHGVLEPQLTTPEDFDRAVEQTLAVLDHRSPSLTKLFTALSKAQSQMEGAAKDSLNPHFKSKYADLASCWDACRKPLTDNGLTILQPVKADRASVTVTTILAHNSGEWMSESLTMTAGADTPQAIGSAITYGRRYGLCAMVGIAPEDDDGEGATRPPARGEWAPPPGMEAGLPGRTETADPTVRMPAGLDGSTLPKGVVYIKDVTIGMGTAKGFLTHTGQPLLAPGLPMYDAKLVALAMELCPQGIAVRIAEKKSQAGNLRVESIVREDSAF